MSLNPWMILVGFYLFVAYVGAALSPPLVTFAVGIMPLGAVILGVHEIIKYLQSRKPKIKTPV